MLGTRIRTALGLAFLLGCCGRALALNPSLEVNQYAHAAWTIGSGFLGSRISSIAQTPDGYLWLGTEDGLLRFDGVRTVRWQPRHGDRLPSPVISKLIATRDGRLWIGTLAGLASLKDGRLTTYAELAGHVVNELIEDSKGTVWVGTVSVPHARLCAIRDRVVCGEQENRFGNGVLALLEDRGTLWVGASSGLWRWAPGEPTRYDVPTPNVSALTLVDQSRLLVALPGGLNQFVNGRMIAYPIEGASRPFDAEALLLDRDGGLWIGTLRHGLIHVHNGRADWYTRADGLSGDAISALYEDREGNIWVATNEGLDRFHELPVTTLSSRQGLGADLGLAVLPARDGSVWVATPDGVSRWKDGRVTTYGIREGLPDGHVGTLFEDSSGRILATTLLGTAAFDGSRFVVLRSLSPPTRVVYNIVEPRPGELWINDHDQGLIHLRGDAVVKRVPWPALGRADHANSLVADRKRNGLWIGFYNGGVAFLEDGAVRKSYGTGDGLGAGRVSELQLADDGTLWAATNGGLSRITDHGIATLSTRNGLPCDTVHWTIVDGEGSRWLLLPCGLVRISAAELAAWVADPARSIKSTLFDSADGVRTMSVAVGLNPPAARLPDGKLWFTTPTGLGVVDPGHLPVNTLVPPVQIEQIVADRRVHETAMIEGGSLRLPPRVHDLQIHYTALSLAAPTKVRFRYKLEGVDRDWQEVGNRRQAFYTDLAPRQYRFRVAAANSSGMWNEAGATLDFIIAPAFYQTFWFLALSAGLAFGLIWSAHRFRLRVVERHEQEITALNERMMKAQEQERIRIAGELHDGVMQEMLAVTMMLGTAKRRIADESEAKGMIDKVQQKLIQVGTDIRQLSHDLHPPVLQDAGLPKALQAYCEQFSVACGIPVACTVDDRVSDLSRGAALALFRIVQEALGNAAKHAHPKEITVDLMRGDVLVYLTVWDDGAGFDPGQLGVSGGLGLVMMRERATQLNGRFEFQSAPGRGTTIKVIVPFR